MNKISKYLIGLTRVALGWVMLWSFMDRVWGFGFPVDDSGAWLNGVSPTAEFLSNATTGLLADRLVDLAGLGWVDWTYMLGLLFVGAGLMLGIMVRLAGLLGAGFMILLFLLTYPPDFNPIISYHIIYALLFLFFIFSPAGNWIGINKWWSETRLVNTLPFLK